MRSEATRSRLLRGLGSLILFFLVLAPVPSLAADKGAEKERKPETRKIQSVGEWAYKRLEVAIAAIEAEDYPAARAAMDEMSQKRGLNDHEQALMWQTYGYVSYYQENYQQAAEELEKCLALKALPLPTELSTTYALGQLYLANDRPDDAIRTLEAWLAQTESPSANAYYLVAQAYMSKGDYQGARNYGKKALQATDQPKESWLILLLSAHFELKEYKECVPVLQQLVLRFPKKLYWVQLAAIYSELDEGEKSLATLEMAYKAGLLEKSSELMNLAQLYLYHDVPYNAAKVIEKGMADEIIEQTPQNLELLGGAWRQARHLEQAIPPLTRAAELSEKGDLYMQLAQVYLEREEWTQARKFLDLAIAKGDLADPGNAQLLAGVANYNSKRVESAKRAFRRARDYEKTRTAASKWLQFIEVEAQRAKEIAEAASESNAEPETEISG